MDVAIIADDLTGAADTAVEFTAPGRRVRVALGEPFGNDAVVLAVDTDSREAPPAAAARRVAATVAALARQAPTLWYKKLDSTLRGNIAEEIVAFADATGCSLLLVTPAFPAQGRGFIDGSLRGGEEALDGEKTAPPLPVLLRGAARPMVQLLRLEQVREGPASVRGHLRAASPRTIVIADAMTDADLDTLAVATVGLGRSVAYAGSAGLAAALGRRHGAAVRTALSLPGLTRVLMLVGSRHPASRRQLACAAGRVGSPFVWTSSDTGSQTAAPDRGAVARRLACTGGVALTTPATDTADPSGLADGLARAAVALIAEYDIRRVFCTGGEVARAICDRLGIRHLAVEGRVQEGMPALLALDGMPGLVLVTKAGGFGDDDSMVRAFEYLAGTEVAQ